MNRVFKAAEAHIIIDGKRIKGTGDFIYEPHKRERELYAPQVKGVSCSMTATLVSGCYANLPALAEIARPYIYTVKDWAHLKPRKYKKRTKKAMILLNGIIQQMEGENVPK